MQSIYKPGGADTRETWFSIATFCTFRPFSLFGSDFQLCRLSWSNLEFCFYPALACLNIQATSNISKFLLGISSSRSPRRAWLLSSVGDYVPCQKFAPAKTYRLWPGKFVNYSLLLSLIITKAHLRLCNIIRVITKRILSICDTMWYIAYWVTKHLLLYYRHDDHNRHHDHHLQTFCEQSILAGSTLPSITNPMPSSLLAKCNHRHQFNRKNWPIWSERDWHQRVSILWNSIVLQVCSEALVL